MKYIKTLEELKYNEEHIKLIRKLRYVLGKIFEKNCCGVSKVRYIENPDKQFKHSYSYQDYVKYDDDVMLFNIFIPDKIKNSNVEKFNIFKKHCDDVGLKNERYETDFIGTYEQMLELLNKIKYINIEIYSNKYNL